MPAPDLTLKVSRGDRRTTVAVSAQATPGPSAYDRFVYTEAPGAARPGDATDDRLEIDASVLRSRATLEAFLASLLGAGTGTVPVWIRRARLERLRTLLGISAAEREFEVAL